MNDNDPLRITDTRLLAALRAVNPSLEDAKDAKLRLQQELVGARARERRLSVELGRYAVVPKGIALLKAIGLLLFIAVSTGSLVAFWYQGGPGLLDITLLAGILVLLALVDWIERGVGRWQLGRDLHYAFVRPGKG